MAFNLEEFETETARQIEELENERRMHLRELDNMEALIKAERYISKKRIAELESDLAAEVKCGSFRVKFLGAEYVEAQRSANELSGECTELRRKFIGECGYTRPAAVKKSE